MPEGNVPTTTPTETDPTVGKATQVLRLLAHDPEQFTVEIESAEPQPGSRIAALVVTRHTTDRRRSYELAPATDWAFELETDLKAGHFGPP